MPAKSKKQQRFFGLVKSIQEGKSTGSDKAKDVAKDMSKKDVSDFASTKTDKLPESKKEALDADIEDLLGYGLASTAAGLGAGGLYWLTKQLTDSANIREHRIEKQEKRLSVPKLRKLQDVEDKSGPMLPSPEDMTSDADRYLSEISPELQDQMSDVMKSSSWGAALLKGIATPVAMLAPGLATYAATRIIVDNVRKKKLEEELQKAKKEFEDVLSKTSNDLQKRVDSLEKSAGILDWITYWEKDTVPTAPAVNTPESIRSPSGALEYIPYGLGLTAGVGGLLGAYLVNEKMKKDPEKEKLKALEKILKRQISAQTINAPIDIQSDSDSDSAKFKL